MQPAEMKPRILLLILVWMIQDAKSYYSPPNQYSPNHQVSSNTHPPPPPPNHLDYYSHHTFPNSEAPYHYQRLLQSIPQSPPESRYKVPSHQHKTQDSIQYHHNFQHQKNQQNFQQQPQQQNQYNFQQQQQNQEPIQNIQPENFPIQTYHQTPSVGQTTHEIPQQQQQQQNYQDFITDLQSIYLTPPPENPQVPQFYTNYYENPVPPQNHQVSQLVPYQGPGEEIQVQNEGPYHVNSGPQINELQGSQENCPGEIPEQNLSIQTTPPQINDETRQQQENHAENSKQYKIPQQQQHPNNEIPFKNVPHQETFVDIEQESHYELPRSVTDDDLYSNSSREHEMAAVFTALNLPVDFATPKDNRKSPDMSTRQPHPIPNFHRHAHAYEEYPDVIHEYNYDYEVPSQYHHIHIKGHPIQHQKPRRHPPKGHRPPPRMRPSGPPPGHPDVMKGDIRQQLHMASQSKTNIFGRLVRLVLAIASQTLNTVKPLIVGIVNKGAETSLNVAHVTSHVANHIPAVAGAKADFLKNLGDASSRFLHDIAWLIHSISTRNLINAQKLPHTFDLLTDTGEQLVLSLCTVAQGLADSTHFIVSGVSDTVKIKGKLVKGLVGGD